MSGRRGFRNRGISRGRVFLNSRQPHNQNSRGSSQLRGRSLSHNVSPRAKGQIIRRLARGAPVDKFPRGTSRGGIVRDGLHTRPPLVTRGKAILQRLGAPTDARDRLIHTRRRSVNDARTLIRKTQLSKTGDLRAVLKSTEKTEDPELARELARVQSERTNTRENSDDVLLSLGSSLHHTDSINAPRNTKGANTLVISRNFPESNQPPSPDDYPPEHPLDITPPPPLMSIGTTTWSSSPSPDQRPLGYWDDDRGRRPNITRTFERSRSRSRSSGFNRRYQRRAHSAERHRSPDRGIERDRYRRGPRDTDQRDPREPRGPRNHNHGDSRNPREPNSREPRELHSPFAPILKEDRHKYRELSPEIRSTVHRAGYSGSHSRFEERERRYREPSPRYNSPLHAVRRRSYSRSPREYRQFPDRWNGPSPSHPPSHPPPRRSISPSLTQRRTPPEYHRERRASPQYSHRPVGDNFKNKPETVSRGRYEERRPSPPLTGNGKTQPSDKYRRSNSKQGHQSGLLNSRPHIPAHPPGASANGSRLPNKIYYRVRITNLGDKVHQGDVQDLFGEMGKIKSVSMKSVGTAEVTYYDHNSVERSIEEYHRRELDNRPMEVVYMGEV